MRLRLLRLLFRFCCYCFGPKGEKRVLAELREWLVAEKGYELKRADEALGKLFGMAK